MFWFSTCIFAWGDCHEQMYKSGSHHYTVVYEDCANQTSCTDMPLDAYYPVLLPVTNLFTVWSRKVATLALTNSPGCGFGNSTRSWGLLSHCDCQSGVFVCPPSLQWLFKRHQIGTCFQQSVNHNSGIHVWHEAQLSVWTIGKHSHGIMPSWQKSFVPGGYLWNYSIE